MHVRVKHGLIIEICFFSFVRETKYISMKNSMNDHLVTLYRKLGRDACKILKQAIQIRNEYGLTISTRKRPKLPVSFVAN